jgi:hypothetical protein
LRSGREGDVESLSEEENKLVKEMLASQLGIKFLPDQDGLIEWLAGC